MTVHALRGFLSHWLVVLCLGMTALGCNRATIPSEGASGGADETVSTAGGADESDHEDPSSPAGSDRMDDAAPAAGAPSESDETSPTGGSGGHDDGPASSGDGGSAVEETPPAETGGGTSEAPEMPEDPQTPDEPDDTCRNHEDCERPLACNPVGRCDTVEPPVITTMTLTPVPATSDFDQRMAAEGGRPPLTWSLVDSPRWLQMEDNGRLHAEAVPGPAQEHPVMV